MKKFLMKVVTLSLFAVLLFGSVTALYAGGGSSRTSSGPVTITMLLLGNAPTNGRHAAALERINAITRDRIGATLRTRYIEWADWQNQYQLALAAQDPNLDLVITATDWLYAWEITAAAVSTA
jgi:putative aldouronate transport system substrate-binding protein